MEHRGTVQCIDYIASKSHVWGGPDHTQKQITPETNAMLILIPRYQNQTEGGDPSLQTMVMLVSLVCDSGVFSIMVGEN